MLLILILLLSLGQMLYDLFYFNTYTLDFYFFFDVYASLLASNKKGDKKIIAEIINLYNFYT